TTSGEVDLGDVTGHDDLGTEAEPGEEHLHLLGRRVLRLVEDYKCVVKCTTAHVGQRGDLDRAVRHQPGGRVRIHHDVQRVVHRPQVEDDLLEECAGQETEPLARLDGRAGEDDAVDLLGLQRLHRLGHGEVGPARTGGPDAEHDGVLGDRVHVPLLAQRLG